MSTGKGKVAILLAVGIVAVAFPGSTAVAQVYTDPVGFVRVNVVTPGLTMISMPFDATPGGADMDMLNGPAGCIGHMMREFATPGSSALAADVIWKWDASVQKYAMAFLVKAPGSPYDGKWFDPSTGTLSTMRLNPGEGFWLEIKKVSGVLTITFLGWVPMEPTRFLTFLKGLNMFGWPYPTTLALNDTFLYELATGGPSPLASDVVYQWDPVAKKYILAFLVDAPGSPFDGKWFDPVAGKLSEITFRPGAAFWFERRAVTPITWPCVRPY